MEDNSYIKYTRSLHDNEKFKSLSFEYRHIYLTILVHMAFETVELNDHGVTIRLQPGQFMTTVRELVRLCDEESIDKSKVERALKMFEKLGFSRQETRHTKTIITITDTSICANLKRDSETTFETRSRQDRDKIETQKKNIQEVRELKEEHTPLNPQTQGKPKDSKRVSESYSFKSSSEKPSQTLKTGYGKEQLVYLTSAEYKKLCDEEGMSDVERTYWINQLEIAMMREGVKE